MSWPSPINGGQGSWTTKLVIGALAFVILLSIGYYNGRQAHPELFDPDYVSPPKPNSTANVPGTYPQIDMTEALAKEAIEAKKTAAKEAVMAKKAEAEAKKAAAKEAAEAKKAEAEAKQAEEEAAKAEAEAHKAVAKAKLAQTANDTIGAETKLTPVVNEKAETKAKASAGANAESTNTGAEANSAAESAETDSAVVAGSPSPSPTVPQLQDGSAVPGMVYDTSWPPPQNRPRTESTFMQRIPTMLFFLAIVCAMIWITLRLIAPLTKKLTGNPAKEKQITVVERQSLAPNKILVLVTVADKKLLLGVTDKSISTLTEWQETPNATPADDDSATSDSPEGEEMPSKNLVKEVIAKHLEALPSLTK